MAGRAKDGQEKILDSSGKEEEMPSFSTAELKSLVGRFPRQKLIHLPTPLWKLSNLSTLLGGPEIFVKRDDLTGLAFGGNKSRKLEFILADALNKGADTVITWASLQSNWCLQTAVAARRFGLHPILVLFKKLDQARDYDGNLLLDFLVEADIRIKEAETGKVVTEEQARHAVEEIVSEVRKKGHNPYVVAVGGSKPGFSMELPLGAISYVEAFGELIEQAEASGFPVTHILHATGSGATQAGLVVASAALERGTKVIGISVSDPAKVFSPLVLEIVRQVERALGLDGIVQEKDIIVIDDYLAAGYAVLTREVAEAIRMTFVTEGIVLDPVYTGKAMAALFDLVKKGYFSPADKIVFFHTGGTPALFPYRKELVDFLR